MICDWSKVKHNFIKYLYLSLLVALAVPAIAQRPIPEHGAVWVHDEAGVLSASGKAQLEAILQAHRDSTSNQIAIYIIPSLQGEDIDDYAVRVFEKWQLGQKGKDNGVLFLVAMEDRVMRIEVGYGLEGVLTDAMSSRINRNEVVPYFRQGDYEAGIQAATLAIIKVIAGEYKNDQPQQTKRVKKKSPWSSLLFIALIIFLMSRKNRGGGSGPGGLWTAAMLGSMLGGRSHGGGSWGGGDFGGGGFSGGGGSSDSW